MPEPKDDRKGTEPKDDRKGTEPKDDRKGPPGGLGAGGCGNDGAAMHILQSAAQLCGFLVVAVVAPMSGGAPAQKCSSDGSPRQVACLNFAEGPNSNNAMPSSGRHRRRRWRSHPMMNRKSLGGEGNESRQESGVTEMGPDRPYAGPGRGAGP